MMNCKLDIDSKLIERIAEYPENIEHCRKGVRYDDLHKWFSCNLCMADDEPFNSTDELISLLKSSDETLFKFILVYYFEQVGFNASIRPEGGRCQNCKFEEFNKNNKIELRKHAVVMLKTFKDCACREVQLNNFGCNYNKKFPNENFNKRKLGPKQFESTSKFYKEGNVGRLKEKIEKGEIKEAYDLLKSIKGAGDKVAKFILRDLLFLLTDWGYKVKDFKEENLREDELFLAIPVDIWVRRITLSIPSMRQKVFEIMQDEELDKYISRGISKLCLALHINPLRFDFGAYQIGRLEINNKEWKNFGDKKFDATYNKLQEILLN